MLSQTDVSDVERAVSGGGYESDREDTDPGVDLAGRKHHAEPPTPAVIAVAASHDGCVHGSASRCLQGQRYLLRATTERIAAGA